MKPSDDLSGLLRCWRHQPGPAPDFNREVWARIGASQATRKSVVLRFPMALPLAASLAILAGVGAGVLANRSQADQRFAAAYARTIDPLQMTALPPATGGHQHR